MPHLKGSPTSDRLRARCLLLVSEAGAVPSRLVGPLDRRGMDIVIVRQPPRLLLKPVSYTHLTLPTIYSV